MNIPTVDGSGCQYYLQDSRCYVGNDVLWWAIDRKGYTTDLTQAHVFTKSEAEAQQRTRRTDIPWPNSYIDSKSRPTVDHQCINMLDAALIPGRALNTPRLDGSGRTMPLSELVQALRTEADEQLDRIDGAEESRGHDSGVTALAALLNSAALAIEKLALRVPLATGGLVGPTDRSLLVGELVNEETDYRRAKDAK